MNKVKELPNKAPQRPNTPANKGRMTNEQIDRALHNSKLVQGFTRNKK